MTASANVFPDKGGWNGSILNIPGLLPVDVGSSNAYPVNSWAMQRPPQTPISALTAGAAPSAGGSGGSNGSYNGSGISGGGIDGTSLTQGGGIGGSGYGDAQFANFSNGGNGGYYGASGNGGDYSGGGGDSQTYPGGFYQGQYGQSGAYPDASFGYQIQQTPVDWGGFSQSDLSSLMQLPFLQGQYDPADFGYQIQPTNMSGQNGLSTTDLIGLYNSTPHIDPTRDPGLMDWLHAAGNVGGLLFPPLGTANTLFNLGQGAIDGYNGDQQTTPYLTGISAIDNAIFGTGNAGRLGGMLGSTANDIFGNNTPYQPSALDETMQNYASQQTGGFDPVTGFVAGADGGTGGGGGGYTPDPFFMNAGQVPDYGGAGAYNSIGLTPDWNGFSGANFSGFGGGYGSGNVGGSPNADNNGGWGQ